MAGERVRVAIEPEQEMVDCDEYGCGVWLKGQECTVDFSGDRLRAWTAPDDGETGLEMSVLAATLRRAPQPDGTGRWTIQFGMATEEEALPLARSLVGDKYRIVEDAAALARPDGAGAGTVDALLAEIAGRGWLASLAPEIGGGYAALVSGPHGRSFGTSWLRAETPLLALRAAYDAALAAGRAGEDGR